MVKSESVITEKEESIVPNEEQPIENTVVEETQTTEVVENTDENQTEVPKVEDNRTQEELDQVKQDLVVAQRLVNELTAVNEALAKDLSETLSGFLVDLRMAIGKESNREEALAKYATRSIESLRDSISDLLAEKPAIQPKRTVEQVEKPTGDPIVTNKTMTTESKVVITNEDALLSLLKGKR